MKTTAKISILLFAAFFSPAVLSETADDNFRDGLAALNADKQAEGRVLLRKAADAGHKEAQYELGMHFLQRGNVGDAGRYFKMAADAGHAPSQTEFGLILQLSDDDVLAKTYYEMASKQANPEGDFRLASLLITGQAGAKDPKQALELLKRAAENDHEQAIEKLAFYYIVGGLTLTREERESPEALKVIRKAADNDYLLAMETMINVHTKGSFGQPVDLNQANELQARIKKLKGENDGPKKKGRRSK